jgi:hypothetical protein
LPWRKKWKRNWQNVKYCSDACRRRGRRAQDEALEQAILDLLAQRSGRATICPSEAAQLVARESEWRELMEAARCAARRLVARGEVVIMQGGRIVDPSTAKGAIRIRRA